MKKIDDRERYNLKIITCDGVTCISVEGKNRYQTGHRKMEPDGELFSYRDKRKKRFQILKKLGLWENGRILPQNRRLG